MSPCAILITLRIIVACLSSKGSCPSRATLLMCFAACAIVPRVIAWTNHQVCRSGFKRLTFNRASAQEGPIREPRPNEYVRFMNCTSSSVHPKSAAGWQTTNNNQEEANQ